MKLHYETGIATLIQFISMSLLGFANGVDSVVTTCRATGSDCVSNLIVSIIFFILLSLWFGFVWVLGYTAQERRSPKIAYTLIATEGAIAMVAYFNARHHTGVLSLATSLLDLGLAIWIAILAFRLSRAKGGRIVRSKQQRRRRSIVR